MTAAVHSTFWRVRSVGEYLYKAVIIRENASICTCFTSNNEYELAKNQTQRN
jgi:hypothetical protein